MTPIIEGSTITVSTNGDPEVHRKCLEIRPFGRYDRTRRAWIFPRDPAVLAAFAAGQAPEGGRRNTKPADAIHPAPATKFGFNWLGCAPYAHQEEGTQLLVLRKQYMLAWEPGVGKTKPVCTAARFLIEQGALEERPLLVVCPLSVIYTWIREFQFHAELDVVAVLGEKSKRKKLIDLAKKGRRLFVTPYDTAVSDEKEWRDLMPVAMVCDESHWIKRSSTARYKAIKGIAGGAEYRWALSGTPAPNDLLDWYGQLMFLGEEYAGERFFTGFKNKYAQFSGHEVAPGFRKVVGYKNRDELDGRIRAVCDRKLKVDCLDLPEKVYADVIVELDPQTRKLYDQVRREAFARLESGETITLMNVLVEATRLRQITGGFIATDDDGLMRTVGNEKLKSLLEMAGDRLEERRQTIIWCAFVAEAKLITEALNQKFGAEGDPAAVMHDGSIQVGKRNEIITGFIAGDFPFLVCSTKSLREGVTLNVADEAWFYSRDYTLTDYLQSQDRCHRIGQKRKVTIRHFVAARTVDEKVGSALAKKIQVQESTFTAIGDVI